MKNCLHYTSYATHPLLQCFLQSNLDKNTAGAHKEPSTIYNRQSSNTEEQTLCAVLLSRYNSSQLLGIAVKFRTCPKPHELSRVPLFH